MYHNDGSRHNSNPEPPNARCTVTGKIIYATDKLARRAMIGYKRRNRSHCKPDEQLQAFSCGHCDGWHVGHRPRKQNSRRRQHEKG